MSSIIRIDQNVAPISKNEKSFNGLVGALRYDPHLPRCFESIKHNLAAGRPALMRLHCAANYPTSVHDRYDIDQEGQAVLIVGYDDERRQFAIVDPYLRNKNEEVKVSWIDFDEIEVTMVDSSKGSESPVGTLDSEIILTDGNKLTIKIGLPFMRGTFMDHDSMFLEDIHTTVSLEAENWSDSRTMTAEGTFRFGQQARFILHLPDALQGNVSVKTETVASLCGIRPYEYRDKIGVVHAENFICTATYTDRLSVNI
ncbi:MULTISPECIES: hypothetical protein [unclassified Pannonibacter]|uniref:hypothetical protein n=1 Tax=unclassified Pannonibacter TaxID=2627228 RepID=UPI001648E7F3|nr:MULTISPECIES: hypothetical protein [unclassified Pannonibacter]